MMPIRNSVNEILENIQAVAKAHEVKLTYSNMRVYLKLLDYAEEYKDLTVSDIHGVRFNATTLELAEYCDVSPRIITESLRKFQKCGVIKYKTNKPRPSVITLIKGYYE